MSYFNGFITKVGKHIVPHQKIWLLFPSCNPILFSFPNNYLFKATDSFLQAVYSTYHWCEVWGLFHSIYSALYLHLLNFVFQTCLQSLSPPPLPSSALCLCPAPRRTSGRSYCVNWVSEPFVMNNDATAHTHTTLNTHTPSDVAQTFSVRQRKQSRVYLSNRWCVVSLAATYSFSPERILQMQLLAQICYMTHLL